MPDATKGRWTKADTTDLTVKVALLVASRRTQMAVEIRRRDPRYESLAEAFEDAKIITELCELVRAQ